MKPYPDFRAFLDTLESEGQLLRVKDEVQFEPDLAAASCAVAELGLDVPALLFDNIAGSPGAQVVVNTHGSWPNHALALGMDKDAPIKEQFFEFVRRFEKYDSGTIERVDSAPWQDVTIEKDINLFDILPLFRLNVGDGGTYIDKACIVSRDPDDWDNDDVENAGIYRLMVKGPNRLGIQPVPQHDIAIHLAHAEARGEDLPVAIAIGNEPLIALMSATPLRYDQLEYKMASAMQGAPYKLVKNGQGLDVPWGSEYVLEGRILAREREIEGPFGEFTGYYSGGRNYPVIEIDRVLHRKNPIFESVYVGRPWKEIDYLQAMTTSAPVYLQLKRQFPEVVAVNALYTHGLIVIVSTKVRYGGFGKSVGLGVLTTSHGLGYAKMIIVVDEDIDPFDLNQVMWAMSVRANPDGDVVMIPNLAENLLDPAGSPNGIAQKMIIDATTPKAPDARGDYGQVLDPPEQAADWRKKLAPMINALKKK